MTELTIGGTSLNLEEIFPGMKPWKKGRVKSGVEALLEKMKKSKYIKNLQLIKGRGEAGVIYITLRPEEDKNIHIRFPDKGYIYELDQIKLKVTPPRSHRDSIRVKVTGEFAREWKYFNETHEVAILISEEVVKPLRYVMEGKRKKSDPQEWMRKEIKRLRGLTV